MSQLTGKQVTELAAETELHWNTVYKWARDPASVSQAVRYALASAVAKLGLSEAGA